MTNEENGLTWETAPETLNLKQTAQLLGLTPHTLYRWRQSGKLRAVKLGREWVISKKNAYQHSKEWALAQQKNE
jgi:excisionase family DNA binding protein